MRKFLRFFLLMVFKCVGGSKTTSTRILCWGSCSNIGGGSGGRPHGRGRCWVGALSLL